MQQKIANPIPAAPACKTNAKLYLRRVNRLVFPSEPLGNILENLGPDSLHADAGNAWHGTAALNIFCLCLNDVHNLLIAHLLAVALSSGNTVSNQEDATGLLDEGNH